MLPTPPTDLGPLLADRLPASLSALLRTMGRVLAERGWPAYLVGGVVRDLLLGRPHGGDADVTVQGDGVAAAGVLAAAMGGQVTAHSQFGTAVVQAAGYSIDVVTARREHYPHPGSLPVVEPSDLGDDLARRDFTVNAMAVALAPDHWGRLHDPFDGAADLAARQVRVLHANSFTDDPTRMVRAVRYASRLGFALAPETATALGRHAADLGALSGARRWHELERCLRETAAIPLLRALNDHALLPAIHRALTLPPATDTRLHRAEAARYRPPLTPPALLCLLLWDATAEVLEAVVADLHLAGEVAGPLRALPSARSAAAELALPHLTPGSIVEALDGLPAACVSALALAPADPLTRARARLYWALWRHIHPQLRGDRLLALGVPRGPLVGRYLHALRAEALQEHTTTADEEAWLVQDWLSHGGPPAP